MSFVIDTVGDTSIGPTQKDGSAFIVELLKDYKGSSSQHSLATKQPTTENTLVHEILDELGWNDKLGAKKTLKNKTKLNNRKLKDDTVKLGGNSKIKDVLKKSIVLSPEFENLHVVPPFDVSEKKLKKERQKDRAKTKGKKWFGLPATEMTEEVKRDLEVLQMRSVLDPKHFYKKNDLNVLPKYFQFGTVMDSPVDYYNNRLPKKERKKTLVDELLADANFNKYNKRKYKEIIEDKQKTHYKAWKAAKKLKKNK